MAPQSTKKRRSQSLQSPRIFSAPHFFAFALSTVELIVAEIVSDTRSYSATPCCTETVCRHTLHHHATRRRKSSILPSARSGAICTDSPPPPRAFGNIWKHRHVPRRSRAVYVRVKRRLTTALARVNHVQGRLVCDRG